MIQKREKVAILLVKHHFEGDAPTRQGTVEFKGFLGILGGALW